MPTVPYSPVPTESSQMIATPKLSLNTPEAAFGGGVAKGLGALGTGMEHFGNEIWKRAVALQELKNETEAREADAQYMMRAGELHAQFSSMEGQAAVQAYPKYMADLKESRDKIRDGMSNDMSRKMYDSSSLGFMGRSIFNGAGHAATQMKVAASNAASARIDLFGQDAMTNPQDDVGFERGRRAVEEEVRTQGDLHGWSEVQTADATQKAVSTLWAHRITGLSKVEPFRAEKMLEDHRAELHWQDAEKTENTVRSQLRTVGARNIADQVNADLYSAPDAKRPEESLQSRLQRGEKMAKEQASGDPLLLDYVRSRITADFNSHKSAVRDFEFENNNTIAGAMNGAVKGKVPTTVDELTSLDPKVSAAWDALPEQQKTKFLKQMSTNARGDSQFTTESLKEYQKFKGMAQTDPVEFMAQDFTSSKFPTRTKLELLNLQTKLKGNSAADPRVNRALGILRPTLQAAGITGTTDKEGYYEFVGSLQDALDTFQQENKKAPDAKQVQEIGSRLMQQIVTHKGIIWDTKESLYNLQVPSDVADRIKADPEWQKLGITPSDEQIRRTYVRKRYMELYGEKAKQERITNSPSGE